MPVAERKATPRAKLTHSHERKSPGSVIINTSSYTKRQEENMDNRLLSAQTSVCMAEAERQNTIVDECDVKIEAMQRELSKVVVDRNTAIKRRKEAYDTSARVMIEFGKSIKNSANE